MVGLLDLLLDQAFQLGQFGISVGGDLARRKFQDMKLFPVLLQIIQPAVHIQVRHLECELCRLQRPPAVLHRPHLPHADRPNPGRDSSAWNCLKRSDASFRVIDLFNGALQGQIEGMDRAFQALEEVDLHHADQVILTFGLGEPCHPFFFVERLEFIFDILGRVEQ